MLELIKNSGWLQFGGFIFIVSVGIGIKNLLSSFNQSKIDDDDDDDFDTEIVKIKVDVLPGTGMSDDGVKNMMSSYEKHIIRLRKKTEFYRLRLEARNKQLRKLNDFINVELRDKGRVTKDELEVYFKKD